MGREKSFMLEIEEQLPQIAIKAGVICECSMHPGSYIYVGDDQLEGFAYALATNEWKEGVFSAKLADVRNALKHLLSTTSTECSKCSCE